MAIHLTVSEAAVGNDTEEEDLQWTDNRLPGGSFPVTNVTKTSTLRRTDVTTLPVSNYVTGFWRPVHSQVISGSVT